MPMFSVVTLSGFEFVFAKKKLIHVFVITRVLIEGCKWPRFLTNLHSSSTDLQSINTSLL